MRLLITGVAGFIGMNLAKNLLEEGIEIYGLDNCIEVGPSEIQKRRLAHLNQYKNFNFMSADINEKSNIEAIFEIAKPNQIVHLAAEAGIKNCLINPDKFLRTNLLGFGNILEACRNFGIHELIYASSSSVYGRNASHEIKDESEWINMPSNLYAATKASNELMAHSYGECFGIKSTGLRFFTVYGPWGRPDMAVWKFTDNIRSGDEIELLNFGLNRRAFMFINDLIAGIRAAMHEIGSRSNDEARAHIFNLSYDNTYSVNDLVQILEGLIGIQAKVQRISGKSWDAEYTLGNMKKTESILGFKPKYTLEEGLSIWLDWYGTFHENV
jgi:UDP-glucuronate 4-epimerase